MNMFTLEHLPVNEPLEMKKCPNCDSQLYDWVIHNGTEVIGCSECLQLIDADDEYCTQMDGRETYGD